MKTIRAQAARVAGLFVVDMTETAQAARFYGDYVDRMSRLSEDDMVYCAVALYGDKKEINKLTGSLALYR